MNPNPGHPDLPDASYQSAVTDAVRANIPYHLSRPPVPIRFPPCERCARHACRFDDNTDSRQNTGNPADCAENVNILL